MDIHFSIMSQIAVLLCLVVVLVLGEYPGNKAEDEERNIPWMDKPEKWISFKDSKLHIHEGVQQKLNQFPTKATVISIAGEARKGKSYLLNRFTGQNKGFPIGSTTMAQTEGVWIWVRPHPELKDTAMVLLDTEGLDHTDKGNATQDSMLSSIALLSSEFIFMVDSNLLGKDLLNLRSVIELVKFISNKGEQDLAVSPNLHVVIRNAFLKFLHHKTKESISPQEYLESVLEEKSRSKDLNNIKKAIIEFFNSRTLHPICKPVDDDKKLRKLDQLSDDDIKPEFLHQCKQLIDDVLRKKQVFKLRQTEINLAVWAQLAAAYIENLNQADLNNLISIAPELETRVNKYAEETAMIVFENEKEEIKMPVSLDEMDEIVERILKKALDVFKSKYFGSKEALDIFKEKLYNLVQTLRKTNEDKLEIKRKDDEARRAREEAQRAKEDLGRLERENERRWEREIARSKSSTVKKVIYTAVCGTGGYYWAGPYGGAALAGLCALIG